VLLAITARQRLRVYQALPKAAKAVTFPPMQRLDIVDSGDH
jgi:hypothetical protein